MSQHDLAFPAATRVRPTDPDTSHQAAHSIESKITDMQERVLGELRRAGSHGLTDEELTAILRARGSTARTRRSELQILGFVLDSGRRRKLSSGRMGVVWIAKEHVDAP